MHICRIHNYNLKTVGYLLFLMLNFYDPKTFPANINFKFGKTAPLKHPLESIMGHHKNNPKRRFRPDRQGYHFRPTLGAI